MIKQHLAAWTAFVFLATTAHAEDIEAAPEALDWSGFYLGATIGYAWGDADFDIDPTGDWLTTVSIPFIENATEGTVNPQGIMAGIRLGYDMQFDNVVVGLEGDFSYVDGEDDEEGGAVPTTGIVSSRNAAELTWLSTLRLRGGFAIDRALIYATGGLALADWEVEARMTSAGGQVSQFEESEWKLGWVIGGGIEYALDGTWSINAEYLYADFGKIDGESNFNVVTTFTHDHEVDLTAQVVRAGITYRFQ